MTSDDQNECPLCMEPFEVDDLSFYPCTCGYQICRFCWHRLKIDGNGLCPACRKAYSENPAHFEPLSEDEIVRIKKERRHKEVQKKQKLSENRRHLADVRVVQKNLVFIVGLSHRLADAEILRKNEYFGKFGKITKVVINASPSYAGAQTPSASAYVTYSKPDEALKAIQTVNNVQIDNRVLKTSLGTTKYCSHFLKGIQCPKSDCMYLHDLGEENASFTKEQMSQGKHLEYESKLIENILHIPKNLQNISNDQANQIIINQIHQGLPSALLSHPSNSAASNNNASTTTTSNNNNTTSASTTSSSSSSSSNNNNNNFDKHESKSRSKTKSHNSHSSRTHHKSNNNNNNNINHNNSNNIVENTIPVTDNVPAKTQHESSNACVKPSESTAVDVKAAIEEEGELEIEEILDEPINEAPIVVEVEATKLAEPNEESKPQEKTREESTLGNQENGIQEPQINHLVYPTHQHETKIQNEPSQCENSNLNSNNDCVTELTNFLSTQHVQEEDLGFDPWGESTKALQDLMKMESSRKATNYSPNQFNLNNQNILDENAINMNRQYFNTNQSAASLPPMFKSDMQSLYKLNQLHQELGNSNNVNNGQMYHNQVNMNSLSDAHKLNELLLRSTAGNNNLENFKDHLQQLQLNPNHSHMMSAVNYMNQDFAGAFTQENLLNKLLLQKQTLSKQSIVPPPGFNTTSTTNTNPNTNNNVMFNSPLSASSTSSSSSSTSSSVNNSTSTTPALNAKLASSLMTDFTNESSQENSAQTNKAQLNALLFPKNLQDTLRSIFPNAHISFGAANSSTSNAKPSTFGNSSSSNKTQFASGLNDKGSKKSCWPDDPAIVSLNNGFSKDLNGQLPDLQERSQNDFENLYTNNNNMNTGNPIELLPYLASSLNQQSNGNINMNHNNLNNLSSLLKKQQAGQQLNNTLLNQFQFLYQQHQMNQFNTNNTTNGSFQNNMNKPNQMSTDSQQQQQQQMLNKQNLEDYQNHHKLLLLNNNFNSMNMGNNNLINSYLNGASEMNHFSNLTLNSLSNGSMNSNSNINNNGNNLNGYGGYMIDSNQNIQSANLNGGLKLNSSSSMVSPLLVLQQQQQQQQQQHNYMQQFISNFNNSATANSNSD